MVPERVTDTYAIASWRQLTMWVVEGHTPLDELERVRRMALRWVTTNPGKSVSIIVLHGARSTMSSEERASVARMIAETKHTRAASATVVLGRGVIGALHRSILTGFSLLVPPPHPTRVFADVAPAVAWLHPHLEATCGAVPALHVEAMLEDLYGDLCAEKLRRLPSIDASRSS